MRQARLDRNRIYEGECLEIMAGLPDHCIDMVLCDLPYRSTRNKWDSVISLGKLWTEYKRIVRRNGVMVLTANGAFGAKLIMSNLASYKYKFVWVKSQSTGFLNAKMQPMRQHEDVLVFYSHPPTYNPVKASGEPYVTKSSERVQTENYGEFEPVTTDNEDGGRYPIDVVYYGGKESGLHPTQKPVALGRYLVQMFTNPGDVVLDNACGSGSFCLAAAIEGRDYMGIDLNQEATKDKTTDADYIATARGRLARFQAGRDTYEPLRVTFDTVTRIA